MAQEFHYHCSNTYKLATVPTFHCQYGHKIDVSPDCFDEKPYASANFNINICFVLAMQLLGKGLQTMSIFLSILGIHVSKGNYKIWKTIQDKIGESQQTMAQEAVAETYKKKLRQLMPQALCQMKRDIHI